MDILAIFFLLCFLDNNPWVKNFFKAQLLWTATFLRTYYIFQGHFYTSIEMFFFSFFRGLWKLVQFFSLFDWKWQRCMAHILWCLRVVHWWWLIWRWWGAWHFLGSVSFSAWWWWSWSTLWATSPGPISIQPLLLHLPLAKDSHGNRYPHYTYTHIV